MKILKKAYEFVKDAGSFLRGSIMIVLCFTIVIFGIWNTILSLGVVHSHSEIKDKIKRSEQIYLKIIKEQNKIADSDRKFFIGVIKNIYKRFVIGIPITKTDKVNHTEKQKQWLRVMLGIPVEKGK